tara:strand:+ start:135 stop:371 length:237 start_codon:yes stop_codon:yes gene_type:complete
MSTGLRWDGGFSLRPFGNSIWSNNMSKPCDQENDGSGAIYIEKTAIDAKAWRSRPKKHGFDLLLVNFRKNSKNRQCLT